MAPETTVVHWNDRPIGGQGDNWVYIGRPSPFGNPYVIGHGDIVDRRAAVLAYRRYFGARLAEDPGFKAAVDVLRGMVLVCHCKPLACHGDVIAEYLNGGSA